VNIGVALYWGGTQDPACICPKTDALMHRSVRTETIPDDAQRDPIIGDSPSCHGRGPVHGIANEVQPVPGAATPHLGIRICQQAA